MNDLSLVNKALKILGIITILFLVISTAQAGDWPMFRHDSAHSGKADVGVKPPLELLWEYKTGDSVTSSPAVAEGVVYVGSSDNHVYALDADTGAEKWKYKAAGFIGGVTSSPAVAEGVVYVGSSDNHVYALDADTGTLRWKYKTSCSGVSSSPAVSEGVVYVGGSSDNYVYALDADTGTLRWKYKTGGRYVASSPAVSDGVVYVGASDNYVYALDADTGTLRWKYKTGEWGWGPVIASGIRWRGVCWLME